jgi:hypothetical protein
MRGSFSLVYNRPLTTLHSIGKSNELSATQLTLSQVTLPRVGTGFADRQWQDMAKPNANTDSYDPGELYIFDDETDETYWPNTFAELHKASESCLLGRCERCTNPRREHRSLMCTVAQCQTRLNQISRNVIPGCTRAWGSPKISQNRWFAT